MDENKFTIRKAVIKKVHTARKRMEKYFIPHDKMEKEFL